MVGFEPNRSAGAVDVNLLRERYRVDLVGLQTACELNYVRLMRLLPDMRSSLGERRLSLSEGEHVLGVLALEVLEANPYTTRVRLSLEHSLPWLPLPRLEVQVYHDARMAEVVAAEHARRNGLALTPEAIVAGAMAGDVACEATLQCYEARLARALAGVINLLDPDVIVLGGGLSNLPRLYAHVPQLWRAHVFSDQVDTRLVAAAHGDSSGVRGAAWLWPVDADPRTQAG